MTLYIRPVCRDTTEELIGYALCRSPSGQTGRHRASVVQHFDLECNGKDIADSAREFYRADDVQWSGPLYV